MTTSTSEKTEDTQKKDAAPKAQAPASSVPAKKDVKDKNAKRKPRGGKGQGRRGRRDQRRESEFEQKIIDLSRVTRVMAGGKRMRFRACVAIGDQKGRVAIGLAKGIDVTIAINKAVSQAKKKLIHVPIVNETIPHALNVKVGASRLMFKPAPTGTGIKAGGIVRMILELAGIPNISSKIFGSTNKVNNAKATIKALQMFKVDDSMKKPKSKKKVVAKKASVKKDAKKVTKKVKKEDK